MRATFSLDYLEKTAKDEWKNEKFNKQIVYFFSINKEKKADYRKKVFKKLLEANQGLAKELIGQILKIGPPILGDKTFFSLEDQKKIVELYKEIFTEEENKELLNSLNVMPFFVFYRMDEFERDFFPAARSYFLVIDQNFKEKSKQLLIQSMQKTMQEFINESISMGIDEYSIREKLGEIQKIFQEQLKKEENVSLKAVLGALQPFIQNQVVLLAPKEERQVREEKKKDVLSASNPPKQNSKIKSKGSGLASFKASGKSMKGDRKKEKYTNTRPKSEVEHKNESGADLNKKSSPLGSKIQKGPLSGKRVGSQSETIPKWVKNMGIFLFIGGVFFSIYSMMQGPQSEDAAEYLDDGASEDLDDGDGAESTPFEDLENEEEAEKEKGETSL